MIRFVRRRKWIVPVLVLVIVLLLIPLLGFQEGLSGGEEEPACKLVSSRGILKSCDVHLANPVSSSADLSAYDWNSLQEGCTVYVCTTAIPGLAAMIDSIPVSFVLVSGDADETVFADLFADEAAFKRFIESPRILRWYAQNATGIHPKLHQIPIGLDYHTDASTKGIRPIDSESALLQIRDSAKPWSERLCQGYCNFQFQMWTKYGYDREEAKDQIPADCVFYEPGRTERMDGFRKQAEYAFVVSPHGNGYDCHRTWEALCLGCIPIVRTSGMDPLYEGLPVLIVDKWSDVSPELLRKTVQDFSQRTFQYERLQLAYWMNRIRNG